MRWEQVLSTANRRGDPCDRPSGGQATRADTWVRPYGPLSIALLISLALGCTKVPQDPNDPENGVWNPLDENAPETIFRPPKARIVEGPADGQRLPRDFVMFRWTRETAHTARFRYYFDGDSTETTDTTTTFSALDEGSHEFWVRGLTAGGKMTPDDKLDRRRFAVTSFLDPAVYVSPRAPVAEFGTNFSVEVRVAGFARVDSERVKGIRVVLQVPTNADYQGLDSLGYLGRDGGRVFWWTGRTGNLVTFEAVRAGDPPVALSDSGAVARLRLRARAPGVDSVRVKECEVFNGNNHPLAVITRGAKVEVK